MTQEPREPVGDDDLPDFGASVPDRERVAVPGPQARRRSGAVILTVVGAAVVAIAVIALVLSQTVFRGALEASPTPQAAPTVGTASGHSEYIPDPNDPDLEPPPPIFTQKPTAPCTAVDTGGSYGPDPGPGTLRGGSLQVSIPQDWDYPWTSQSVSYLTGTTGYARHVEGSWYSVVNLGRVDFPADEGGYPGAEQAAITIFQCYATSGGLIEYFGNRPQVSDYRSEATVVDGTPAWIVQATYHFEKSQLQTTSASVVTSIVVDTPGGPSALISDVAADHPDHMEELQGIVASLRVTS